MMLDTFGLSTNAYLLRRSFLDQIVNLSLGSFLMVNFRGYCSELELIGPMQMSGLLVLQLRFCFRERIVSFKSI